MSIRTNINYVQLIDAAKTSFVWGKNLVFSIEKKLSKFFPLPTTFQSRPPLIKARSQRPRLYSPPHQDRGNESGVEAGYMLSHVLLHAHKKEKRIAHFFRI